MDSQIGSYAIFPPFGAWISVSMKQFSGNFKVCGVKDKINENIK